MVRIIIHVGLHKTGTSFLQKHVFPFLDGDLDYLGRPYRDRSHFLEAVCWSRAETILISSETFIGRLLDAYQPGKGYLQTQLEGLRRLGHLFPNAAVIMGVRPHVSWIESVYKHYLKYGGSLTMERFFQLNGTGLMRTEDFLFEPRLQLAWETFSGGLLVYNSATLAAHPDHVIARIEAFTETRFTGAPSFRRENEGVGARQAKALRILNKVPGLRAAGRSIKALDPFNIVRDHVEGDLRLNLDAEMAMRIRKHYSADWYAVEGFIGERLKKLPVRA